MPKTKSLLSQRVETMSSYDLEDYLERLLETMDLVSSPDVKAAIGFRIETVATVMRSRDHMLAAA